MSDQTGASPTPPSMTYDAPVVPTSAWALAWSFVLGQVLVLVERGTQQQSSMPLSILLGVALVVFFSHGVMRARLIRFGFVVLLTGLAVVLGLAGLVVEPSAWGAVSWLMSVAQAWLLWTYAQSPWFAWQRTRPSGGPSLAPILAVAVVVGVFAGVLGSADVGGTGIDSELGVRSTAP